MIASAVVASLLVKQMPPWYINPDTAHHVSVAKSLLAGDGFSTNVLYYDEQYSSGRLPAPQTLWPPGYPALIAAVAVFGVPEVEAAFFLSIFAHLLIALLLAILARAMGLRRSCDFIAAAIWLALIPAALLPLSAFTEPVFTALTLLSTALVMRAFANNDQSRLVWLVAGGAVAGVAFSIRYMGICFIAALALVMAVRYLRTPSWRTVREGIALLTVPIALVVVIFVRNAQLTGDPSGGPAVSQGTTFFQVVESLYWSTLMALGITGSGPLRTVSILVLGVLLSIALVYAVNLSMRWAARQAEMSRCTFFAIAFFYSLLTAGVLVYVAYGRTHELIQWRYLIPLVPFGILLIVAALSDALASSRRPMVIAIGGLALALFVLGQRQAFAQWDDTYINVRQGREIETVMHERVGGRTLLDVLSNRPQAPILTQDGQALAPFVSQPVLGMASPFYTKTIWSEAAVLDLVDRYDVGWIAFFPRMFHPGTANDGNRVFFEQIASKDVPEWLQLVYSTEHVQLFEVRATP